MRVFERLARPARARWPTHEKFVGRCADGVDADFAGGCRSARKKFLQSLAG